MNCAIADCERPTLVRDWCTAHYKRWRRHGDPLAGRVPNNLDPAVRFWAKVEEQPNGCLIWSADAKDDKGYGLFSVEGKTVRAHIWAFLQVAQIPEGLQLDHICRNRPCVNWSHLEPVTGIENMIRSWGNGQREKTHCANGHPYDLINTYITREGHRSCRICMRASKARGKERSGQRGNR